MSIRWCPERIRASSVHPIHYTPHHLLRLSPNPTGNLAVKEREMSRLSSTKRIAVVGVAIALLIVAVCYPTKFSVSATTSAQTQTGSNGLSQLPNLGRLNDLTAQLVAMSMDQIREVRQSISWI